MDDNAVYVAAAYLIVTATLGSYTAWVVAKLRRARRDSERS